MKALLALIILWFTAVTAAATITFSPASVTITAPVGTTPAARDVVVSTSSNNASWSAGDVSPWFDAYPATGNDGGVIHITFPFDISGYAPGVYLQFITFSATGHPVARLLVTLRLTSTPPVSTVRNVQIPISSLTLRWTKPPSPAAKVKIFDCRRECTPPNYPGAVLIHTVSVSTSAQQTARLYSSMLGTKLIRGTQHIYLLRSLTANGFESGFSNPVPYTVP